MLKRLNLAFKSLRHNDVRTLTLRNQPLSTISKQSSNHNIVNESHILAELSSLLPISLPKDSKKVDSYLSPEEKLRGVFLQKPKGKFAVEKALTSLGIVITVDVLRNVIDRGNLSGESIVTFFNWAVNESNDVAGYHYVVLKALGRRKYFDCMMNVLKGMDNVDLVCLRIVIDSFVKAGHVRRAVELFDEIIVDCKDSSDTERFNVLLRCLCERSCVRFASSVFNRKRGKDVCSYNVMLSGWGKVGDVEEMEKVVKEMVECGFGLSCLSYSYVIQGLGRAGRVVESVAVFDGVKEKDVSVYNAVICNFLIGREFDESLRYYRRMVEEGCEADLVTYEKLVSGLIRGRKVSDALEVFEEMLSRRVVPTTGVVTSFIKPLCSYGPPHAAMVIYQKARKAGCRVSESAYKLLLCRLSRFGKCGLLLNVWDEMQESGYGSDVEVYEYIVDGLCNIGHLDNAVLVLEEAIRKGFCPNRLVCSRLSKKLIASNKTEMAYKLFLKIKGARVKENARVFWRRNGWHF